MSKGFLGVIAAVILIFIGIFVISGDKTNAPGGKNANSSKLTQHVQGKGSTGVKLVEYGDYQCPYCQAYYATVKTVQAQLNDQIFFQFRNFPLTSLHRNAFAASRAAEAAGMQDKYWEMHDILYENNDPNGATGWVASKDTNSYFEQFAKQIGLDLAKYKTDFASSAVNDAINADLAEGTKLGITGTPTFYLDGKKVDNAQLVDSSGRPSTAAFEKVIKAEIAKKQPASSTTGQ